MTVLPIKRSPPPNVGRLMGAEQVAAELFNGTVTPGWVKRHLEAGRVSLGYRTVVWAEELVRAWVAEKVGNA